MICKGAFDFDSYWTCSFHISHKINCVVGVLSTDYREVVQMCKNAKTHTRRLIHLIVKMLARENVCAECLVPVLESIKEKKMLTAITRML